MGQDDHRRASGSRSGADGHSTRRGWAWARLGAIAAVSMTMLGVATGGVASAAAPTYSATATATGAQINLFGTELTGGKATVAVDTATPSVTAEGVGTLTPGLVEDQKAAVTADGATQTKANACSQGGGTPAGTPITLSLGLACSSASAALSSTNLPNGAATGEVAGLNVNVAGLLNQIIQSGGNQLFGALQQVLGQLNSSLGTGTKACPSAAGATGSGSGSFSEMAATPSGASALTSLLGTLSNSGSPLSSVLGTLGLGGSNSPLTGATNGTSSSAPSAGALGNLLEGLCQTLTNVENVVKSSPAPNTLVVKVGPASASVVGTAPDAATATAQGATLDVQILPGVGCTSSLTNCITDPSAYAAPLVEIKVADAKSTDVFNGTTWVPSGSGSVAEIDLNIPGFAQTISVAPGQSQDLLAGTPLETVIDLGSASTTGTTNTAHGATVDLLKGVNGGILLNLGSTTTTGTPVTTAAVTQASSGGSSPTGPVTLASGGSSPTAVHTGLWFAGSLPFLLGFGALGGTLIGWPRLRRTSLMTRLLARARR